MFLLQVHEWWMFELVEGSPGEGQTMATFKTVILLAEESQLRRQSKHTLLSAPSPYLKWFSLLFRDAIVNFLKGSRSALTFCSLLENLPKDIRFVEKRRPQSSKKVSLSYYFISVSSLLLSLTCQEQEIKKMYSKNSKLDPKLQKQEVKKPKLDAPIAETGQTKNLERKRKCPEYRPVCLGKGDEMKKPHFEFNLDSTKGKKNYVFNPL